jgi:hypothetical protein
MGVRKLTKPHKATVERLAVDLHRFDLGKKKDDLSGYREWLALPNEQKEEYRKLAQQCEADGISREMIFSKVDTWLTLVTAILLLGALYSIL